MAFGPQKSLFRPQGHVSRLRPPGSVKFYKHYTGFAAVARAGAKGAKITKFSGKVTSGAKMSPKVTFCDFRAPKVTFRAQALRCACSHQFLDVFSVPGSRNVTFSLKSHFFALLRLWRPKVTFCGKVTFWPKSGFWEDFPLQLALFLKVLERSAPTVIFGGEKCFSQNTL